MYVHVSRECVFFSLHLNLKVFIVLIYSGHQMNCILTPFPTLLLLVCCDASALFKPFVLFLKDYYKARIGLSTVTADSACNRVVQQ